MAKESNHRIEIMNPQTGLRLECNNVRELKEVFLHSNIIRYYIVNNHHPITFEQRDRIEIGTPQLNFVFDINERSIEDEVEFMKKRIREIQSYSSKWFDKRTREYKHAFSFPNGFNTPLIFKELK